MGFYWGFRPALRWRVGRSRFGIGRSAYVGWSWRGLFFGASTRRRR